MVRRVIWAGLVPVGLWAGAVAASGKGRAAEFTATLTGAAERPQPVNTTAKGVATIKIDEGDSTLVYTITVTELKAVTAAHIHTGGPEEAGPPVATLIDKPIPGTSRDTLAADTLAAKDVKGGFAALMERIRSGQAYVNIHTREHPNGEIRGQLQE